MPFGLTNAPATALRVGNRAFFDLIDRFLVIFMDDTIVYSPDFDSHVSHVRQFLQRCREHQFFIRPSKVELFVRSIDFIGHHISEAGLSIIEDRIRAVMAIQPPVSYGPTVGKQPLRRMAKDGKSSLRSFLGMVGQFRRFIPKFSKIAEPLNRLLKDNAEFVWESEQQQAFDNLKSAICNAPVLQLPDQKLPSIMEVDGSGTHVGQVILQDQGKGMKPCGYHSVTLSDTQRRWPIPEIELFAIVEGFRFFRHILLGAPETIVRSDHQPLVYFQSKSTLSPKQARWLDELSEYNFRIEHIAGDKNKVADALTRISALFELTDCLQHIDISEVMPSADPTFIALISSSSAHQLHDIIISEYDRDTFAQTILAKLTSSTSSQSVSSYSFELIQGLIYRKTIYGRQLYIPPTAKVPTDDGEITQLRHILLHECHSATISGHVGKNRMLHLLRSRYYWPGMTTAAIKYIRECPVCQRQKTRRHKPYGQAHIRYSVPKTKWLDVSLDWITDLPITTNGHDSIFVVMCQFSHRCHLIPFSMTWTAQHTASIYMQHIFKLHGLPRNIISDRDPRFTSTFWQTLWKSTGTRLSMTSSHHPQSNAANERNHAFIEDILR